MNYDKSILSRFLFLSIALLISIHIVLGQSANDNLAPKTITVNGVNLHYIEKGKGTPVVFVHGAFGDYRTWHYQMKDFAEKHRTFSYSRRYYYPNEVPIDSTSDFSMLNVNDLVAFIQNLDVGKVHLVGHSSGAWIALLATIHHPELMRSLTLAEPPVVELLNGDEYGTSLMEEAVSYVFKPATEAFGRNEDQKAAELFINGVVGDPHFFENLDPIDQKIMLDNIAERKAALLVQNPVHKRPTFTCTNIQTIKVPVLLLSGEETPEFQVYLTDKLEACLQHKKKFILPNTSHGMEYQSPESFNKAVLSFIDKH